MGIETLAAASLAATVIGGGISAVGGVVSGQASQAAANYRGQVARNNAIYTLQKGQVEAQAQGFKTGALQGKQLAAFGASGLEVNSGSHIDVQASTAEMGKLDELTILNNAANRALGLQTEAQLDEATGKAAATEGKLKGFGSLISTASSVSDKWLGYQQRGWGST